MKIDALFQQIEIWQEKTTWGNTLDAGTGEHSLRWLLTQNTSSLTAITGDKQRELTLKEQFKEQLGQKDRIRTGNWLNQSFLEQEKYDTVIADYLLGAIEGFAPYFQHKLFSRLRQHCKGTLYVIGQEPFPLSPVDPGAQLIWELNRLRDSCILLAGHSCYREYPQHWVLEHLELSGYRILRTQSFPIYFSHNYCNNQLRVCQSKLRFIENRSLARELSVHIEALKERFYEYLSLNRTIQFGEDYVIQATIR